MTKWSFDDEKKIGTLTIAGDMTINHIGGLMDSLLEAFSCAEQVIVDVSPTTGIDVAGLQLLSACQRFSFERGKQMCLRLGENTRFAQFLDEVGFARDFICNHGCAKQCPWPAAN
jgi:anti-anti-sigma regulatory factor